MSNILHRKFREWTMEEMREIKKITQHRCFDEEYCSLAYVCKAATDYIGVTLCDGVFVTDLTVQEADTILRLDMKPRGKKGIKNV